MGWLSFDIYIRSWVIHFLCGTLKFCEQCVRNGNRSRKKSSYRTIVFGSGMKHNALHAGKHKIIPAYSLPCKSCTFLGVHSGISQTVMANKSWPTHYFMRAAWPVNTYIGTGFRFFCTTHLYKLEKTSGAKIRIWLVTLIPHNWKKCSHSPLTSQLTFIWWRFFPRRFSTPMSYFDSMATIFFPYFYILPVLYLVSVHLLLYRCYLRFRRLSGAVLFVSCALIFLIHLNKINNKIIPLISS